MKYLGRHILGDVIIKSDIEIQSLGKIISNHVLGGLKFGEEIDYGYLEGTPLIGNYYLGFSIHFYGFPGFTKGLGYSFSLIPNYSELKKHAVSFNISDYLTELFKEKLSAFENIKILDYNDWLDEYYELHPDEPRYQP